MWYANAMSRSIIIFDLDGTLVDTEKVAMAVTEDYFKKAGSPLSDENRDFLMGRAWEPALRGILEDKQLDLKPEKVIHEVVNHFRGALKKGVPEIPSSSRAVKALVKDFRLAVVSGSYREDIFVALKSMGVTDCIELVLGCEDYPETKPSPSPYLEALKRLEVKDEKVLVFEDSPAGFKSAEAAGLAVVQVYDFSDVDAAWVEARAKPVAR